MSQAPTARAGLGQPAHGRAVDEQGQAALGLAAVHLGEGAGIDHDVGPDRGEDTFDRSTRP